MGPKEHPETTRERKHTETNHKSWAGWTHQAMAWEQGAAHQLHPVLQILNLVSHVPDLGHHAADNEENDCGAERQASG